MDAIACRAAVNAGEAVANVAQTSTTTKCYECGKLGFKKGDRRHQCPSNERGGGKGGRDKHRGKGNHNDSLGTPGADSTTKRSWRQQLKDREERVAEREAYLGINVAANDTHPPSPSPGEATGHLAQGQHHGDYD